VRGHTREQREDALDEGRALLGDVGGHTLQGETGLPPPTAGGTVTVV